MIYMYCRWQSSDPPEQGVLYQTTWMYKNVHACYSKTLLCIHTNSIIASVCMYLFCYVVAKVYICDTVLPCRAHVVTIIQFWGRGRRFILQAQRVYCIQGNNGLAHSYWPISCFVCSIQYIYYRSTSPEVKAWSKSILHANLGNWSITMPP